MTIRSESFGWSRIRASLALIIVLLGVAGCNLHILCSSDTMTCKAIPESDDQEPQE